MIEEKRNIAAVRRPKACTSVVPKKALGHMAHRRCIAGTLSTLLALIATAVIISVIFTKKLYLIGIAALHCFLYAMQMLALYIFGLYFARIQGNQGAARVPCAGTKLQVNDRKSFLTQICMKFVYFVTNS